MIKPESIENLKSQIDIVDVVGNYVQLKKSGASYKGLCPFHSEKTPSFIVTPSKEIYHCFGCGAHGDAIKFIMEIEKLNYREAIEKLAALYNFPLEYTSSKNFLQINILEKVNNYYKSELFKNRIALDYLEKRKISKNSIEKFGLGFAPEANSQLRYFKNANLNFKELIKLGVLTEQGYPRLNERITFPIFNERDKIIAFGGRTISNHPAKYINFSNTQLFNKSRTLYGLNFAKEYARKGNLIITEGYFDTIMLHQAGIKEATATLGTSLTNYHLPIIKKFTNRVIVAYDSDRAGIEAAMKASQILYANYFEGGVVLFPEGADPADLIAAGKDVTPYFKNPIPFDEFIINFTIKKYNISNPIQKKMAIEELRKYISGLEEISQNAIATKVAPLLQINENILKTKKIIKIETESKKIDITEASIIKSLYENPHLLNDISEFIKPEMFLTHSEELKALFKEDFENEKLLDITLKEEVKVLDYENLKKSLLPILIRFYTNKQQEIKAIKMSDANEKIAKIKEIGLIIYKLRKGELVEVPEFI